MEASNTDTSINAIKQQKRTCGNCGLAHPPRNCPAYNDICSFCKTIGHWSDLCRKRIRSTGRRRASSGGRSSRYRSPSRDERNSRYRSPSRDERNSARGRQHRNSDKKVAAVSVEDQLQSMELDDDSDTFTFESITTMSDRDEAYAILDIKIPSSKSTNFSLKLKVDTGAQGNTLPVRIFRRMFPELLDTEGNPKLAKSDVRLLAYNNSNIPNYGVISIPCSFQNSVWESTPFYVVDVPGPAVVGLPTCEKLGIVTMHCAIRREHTSRKTVCINNAADLKDRYPSRFEGIGCFPGEVKLHLDHDVPPHIDPPRKTPIALREQIKTELDKMETLGVIRRVEEPTEWVSSLVYSKKKDGSLRICLDPKHLNKALKRPHHKIPTLEEVNHRLNGAKYFSKLDAKCGYWSVKLHPDSQLLTTFQTPFGRFCFTRLPFGLNVSQDIFQAKMDEILDGLDGVIGIADDIAVVGETEECHEQNLTALMERAEKHKMVLNYDKCTVKAHSIEFFGQVYSSEGIKPAPAKIADLESMKNP